MSLCALSCWLLPAALLLSPCLAACTGLTFDLSSSSSNTALPQGFTLSMLGSFSKVPCLLWVMTSLLCSYFSLPCTLAESCSLTAPLLFASFIFCLCPAEPRTELCFTELGLATGSWPGALAREKTERAGQLQSWASPAMAAARVMALQGSPIPPCKFNSDLEHTT